MVIEGGRRGGRGAGRGRWRWSGSKPRPRCSRGAERFNASFSSYHQPSRQQGGLCFMSRYQRTLPQLGSREPGKPQGERCVGWGVREGLSGRWEEPGVAGLAGAARR